MKEIPLTQGKVALVDDEDYEYLNQFKWFAHNQRGCWYAKRNDRSSKGKRVMVAMHRLLLSVPLGFVTDHANGNGLDNRRGNLRVATYSGNARNSKKRAINKSGYKGVVFHKAARQWVAAISAGDKTYHLGLFRTALDAAHAYDFKARELFGDFARLNFPDEAPHLPVALTNKTSSFRGVSWHKSVGRWRVVIHINKKQKHVGYFDTEKDAAIAYDREILNLGMNKSFLNFEREEWERGI